MDFYVKLGMLGGWRRCSVENQLFFSHKLTWDYRPPLGSPEVWSGESWILLSPKELSENLEVFCPIHHRPPPAPNFQAQFLDFIVGGLEQLTLHFHLLSVSGLWLLIFGKPLI